MEPAKLLIVDDDRNLLELMRMRLESAHYAVTPAADEDEAKEAVKHTAFDLAVIDLQLVNQDGISLMEELRQVNPEMPAIILTAHGSIETAVEAMRRGAYTYLTKPFDARELLLHIERALETGRLSSEVTRLKDLLGERHVFDNIVARSGVMQRVLETVAHIAPTESTVYIHGESGTGKELVARAIHLAGGRRDQPFVAVNCAALPETLLESELFGHEKGSFTGAIKSSRGLFVQAQGGTIFLDEIGDMPLSIQAKFLRVLQERQFHPVGADQPVQVDVRVIVATNKDLEEGVRQGTFRDDLYYRIHVIPLALPPLRERKDDIPLLIHHFLERLNRIEGKLVKGFEDNVLEAMLAYDWPGNVRELENAVERAYILCPSITIGLQHLPTKLVALGRGEEGVVNEMNLLDTEKRLVIRALTSTSWNQSRAAEVLGISRKQLRTKMKNFGLLPQ